MFEKIKDFFYDISDIVLSLLIIAVIFYSVSWKISDTLSVDMNAPETTVEGEESPTEAPIIIVTPENPDDESVETTEPTTVPETEPPTEAPLELVTFTVPEGSSGYSIGEKLQSEGFIGDVNSFVKRLVEMGYDNKLRAGDFRLSKSDDMDTLIKVLAGQGR